MASRNIVHLQKIILRCVGFCFYISRKAPAKESGCAVGCRRGSRENPDRFTDNRAPKGQESRGVKSRGVNFNCLKCPLLASGVNRTIYLQLAFFLDGALQTYELFHQSQCPCCNECAARQVLSILSVTSCFVNMFLVASKPTHSFRTRMWCLAGWKKMYFEVSRVSKHKLGVTAVGRLFPAAKFCRRLRTCL